MAPLVLLTGATGLIGRATARALRAAGCRVIALSRSGRAVEGAEAEVACDLLDAGARRAAAARTGASHLVHLAWADGKDRWTTPENEMWAEATVALLTEFAAAGGRRALMAGSCAEYDWSRPVLSEETPLQPATPYGRAKARAGQEALARAEGLGVSLVWARPFFVYGPGEPEGRLVGDLVRGLRAGREVACTDGTQRRDYLYADDLGRALALLLGSPAEGAVNVGAGQAIAVRDLIGEVARQMGRPGLVRLGARPRAPGDPDELRADVARLTAATGFRPAFSLQAGVAALLRAEGGGA